VHQAAFPDQAHIFWVPGAGEKFLYALHAAIAYKGLFEECPGGVIAIIAHENSMLDLRN
jgi:hypothetical protein